MVEIKFKPCFNFSEVSAVDFLGSKFLLEFGLAVKK
jgi:hypothetical protein